MSGGSRIARAGCNYRSMRIMGDGDSAMATCSAERSISGSARRRVVNAGRVLCAARRNGVGRTGTYGKSTARRAAAREV